MNLAERAASRMKSPMSVESDHWNACPLVERLRKETIGVAGANDARIRLPTWDNGCEGCRSMTVGGDIDFESGENSEARGCVRVLEGWERFPSGRISLNR